MRVIPSKERTTAHNQPVKHFGPLDAMGCIRGCWSAANCQASLHLAGHQFKPPVDIQFPIGSDLSWWIFHIKLSVYWRINKYLDIYSISTLCDQCLHIPSFIPHSSHCTTFLPLINPLGMVPWNPQKVPAVALIVPGTNFQLWVSDFRPQPNHFVQLVDSSFLVSTNHPKLYLMHLMYLNSFWLIG
jgi:hypothetical protein